MSSPYLVEIRTGGETKSTLRNLFSDVETEFAVDGPRQHVVPHVPLFGRYDTDQGPAVKRSIVDVLSDFDVIPYRIDGFGAFENGTVYVNVTPSIELVSLRERLSEELQSVTFGYPRYDASGHFEFHIPVIEADRIRETDPAAVLEYLQGRLDLRIDEYATRITNLSGDEMLWEYDLLQDRVLEPDEATSRASWRRTESLLDERATTTDHERLVTEGAGVAIELLRQRGWRYYPDPHSYVTDRARADGLYPATRTAHRRELYVGDNYAYLAFASIHGSESVHVLSIGKDGFYRDTVERTCPVCERSMHRYEGEQLLPCPSCSFQYGFDDAGPDPDSVSLAPDPVPCTRCKRPVTSKAVQFGAYVYCDDCVETFERTSETGVVVRSRHGDDVYDETPYVVYWDGTAHPEDDQIAALARGSELADENGVDGLFVYQRTGSHWFLDAYLDTHPDIAADVREKRRKLRGEDRVRFDEKPTPESLTRDADSGSEDYDIRAGGDVIIADTAVKDAVINRADIGNEE
jgi:ribosomal protein L37AE/L43A